MPPKDELMVKPDEQAVIFRDAEFFAVLGPGRYDLPRHLRFFWQSWNPILDIRIFNTGRRELALDAMSVKSSDAETLKIKPVITFQITDARAAARLPIKEEDQLKSDAALALERVMAGHAKNHLLKIENRAALENEVQSQLQQYADRYGIHIHQVRLNMSPSDEKPKDKDDKKKKTLKLTADISHE